MTYISTTYTEAPTITAGKEYLYTPTSLPNYGHIVDDKGYKLSIRLDSCAHINGQAWSVREEQ